MNKPTFHKHGKDWFPHTPGDPMPCDGEAIIYALRNMNDMWGQPPRSVELAKRASWEEWDSRPNEIIGWRYADPQPESAESVTDELADSISKLTSTPGISPESLALIEAAKAVQSGTMTFNEALAAHSVDKPAKK